MKKNTLFTSESVTEGHPDKIADQISDSILDEILRLDSAARVACETFVTTGMVMVGGEITTSCYVDIPTIIRNTLKDIGYINADYGIDACTCAVITTIDKQSPDIAMGVDKTDRHEQGAGDQGMMFGYACKETKELMPLPLHLSHRLAYQLSVLRKGEFKDMPHLDYLRPDGKTQVTVEYEGKIPKRIDTIVISTQHNPEVIQEKINEDIKKYVINPIIPSEMLDDKTKIYINPTGRFVIGGPHADTGLTGRKIIVDTYGGRGRHGGGAFSGKDSTKVDRSAAYMARYIAKNIVASDFADECEVELAYAIGVAEPVSIMIDTFGTGKVDDSKLAEMVRKLFSLTPEDIISYLQLRRPIFKKTASYGHFGREIPEFSWEKTDMVRSIKEYFLDE